MIQLKRATQQHEMILKNLLSLYLHDLSRFTKQLMIDPDGSFYFDGWESLMCRGDIQTFLIYEEQRLCGFVIIVVTSNHIVINDLFLLHSARGRGVGNEVVMQILKQNSGEYHVYQLKNNIPAINFWKKIYLKNGISFEENEMELDGELCLRQTFFK